MSTVHGGMLTDDNLRDVDHLLLQYLSEHPVTPSYARKRLADEGEEYTRGYIQQRLARLEEHGHIENLYDTGMYQLVDDPRENGDA